MKRKYIHIEFSTSGFMKYDDKNWFFHIQIYPLNINKYFYWNRRWNYSVRQLKILSLVPSFKQYKNFYTWNGE